MTNAWPGCNVTGMNYECTNITEIPHELPLGVTSLYVYHSPYLTTISQLPGNITLLSLEYVGVSNFEPKAIPDVSTTLKELHIKGAESLKKIDVGTPPVSSETALNVIVIMNCSILSEVDNIAEYKNLQSITINSTYIQSIESSMFKGLSYVTYLDISYNYRLSYIHDNAFKDMYRLQYMHMTGCNLDRLYGNYFDAAYEKGYLKLVKAMLNPYQCSKMCDFTTWYWGHTGFSKIANIGTCIEVNYNTVYAYQVYDLSRYGAGCQPIFWIAFGSIMGALILIGIGMCILVALCGINYKKYCCCCFGGSRRNRRNSFPNGNVDHTEVDTFYIDVPGSNQAQVPMYDDSPPIYDELTMPPSKSATTPAIDPTSTQASSSS